MSRKYKATIITPFHNTDMRFFEKTYRSLKAQTIGFENIEWIVVLHNCDKEHIDAVRALIGGYDNVFLKELNNNARSASSPRNYALQFVTSPYLEFLDSDDYINPKTLENCIREMEKHHPDIVIFRMAYVKENDSVHSLITDVTLFDCLEEEIILTGDGLRSMELFSSINLTAHPRFFNAEFIKSNHLDFDETITMAEDGYFLVRCYSMAKKIVVLPQFIGHYYYVNDKSAVQNAENLAPKDLLHFSYGFKKIFDLLLEMKAYYNYVFLAFLAGYLQNAYGCPSFKQEDWETLQSDMAPYAKMVTPPPVNKLFSKEAGEMLYGFVVSSILKPHQENDHDYFDGRSALLMILKTNQESSFGKHYHFEQIKTIGDFRNRVPVYTHHEYDKLVRLDTEVGETNVLTCNPIRAYAYDFDESGEQRTVPVSARMYNKMGESIINEMIGETTFLMVEAMPKGMRLNDGTSYDSSLGIRIRSGVENYLISDRNVDGVTTSPISLIFPKEAVRADYLNLLLALRDPNVTQIYASNTWCVCNYIEMLLSQGDILCGDIEKGSISVPHDENDRLYQEIAVRNTPDPVRAQQIREALESEDKGKLLILIWPQLKRIIARGYGKYSLYSKRVARYSGAVELVMPELVTPYGLIGGSEREKGVYKLNTENAFFEFLPLESEKPEDLKLMTEAEAGKRYELVITNGEGIYRMRSNIIVRVVENSPEGMWLTESMRPISDGRRMLSEGEAFESILWEAVGDQLYDYFCYYNQEKNRLEILLELDQGDSGADYSDAIEQKLSQDENYRAARAEGLEACRARVIDKGTHLLWRDERRKKLNAPEDCFMPIHFIRIEMVPVLSKWLDNE